MIILTKKGRNGGNKGKCKKVLPSLTSLTSFLRVKHPSAYIKQKTQATDFDICKDRLASMLSSPQGV